MTANQQAIEDAEKLKKHVSIQLRGEPVWILMQLKKRGLARSATDAIAHALIEYWEKVRRRDLEEQRLRRIEGT